MKSVRLFLLCLLSAISADGWSHDPQSPELPMPPVRETAGGLLKACAATSITPRGRLLLRYCYGYLAGVEETMRVKMEKQHALCTPPGTTLRELARVFVVYVSAHMELFQLPAVTVAAQALQDRFPCKH